ncbi:MAG: hypothetical protein ACO3KD_05305 [Gaiellales bacterium]
MSVIWMSAPLMPAPPMSLEFIVAFRVIVPESELPAASGKLILKEHPITIVPAIFIFGGLIEVMAPAEKVTSIVMFCERSQVRVMVPWLKASPYWPARVAFATVPVAAFPLRVRFIVHLVVPPESATVSMEGEQSGCWPPPLAVSPGIGIVTANSPVFSVWAVAAPVPSAMVAIAASPAIRSVRMRIAVPPRCAVAEA